eukprot:m51a1_g4622 hypothetical protein (785) ;mRNA; r:298950-304476
MPESALGVHVTAFREALDIRLARKAEVIAKLRLLSAEFRARELDMRVRSLERDLHKARSVAQSCTVLERDLRTLQTELEEESRLATMHEEAREAAERQVKALQAEVAKCSHAAAAKDTVSAQFERLAEKRHREEMDRMISMVDKFKGETLKCTAKLVEQTDRNKELEAHEVLFSLRKQRAEQTQKIVEQKIQIDDFTKELDAEVCTLKQDLAETISRADQVTAEKNFYHKQAVKAMQQQQEAAGIDLSEQAGADALLAAKAQVSANPREATAPRVMDSHLMERLNESIDALELGLAQATNERDQLKARLSSILGSSCDADPVLLSMAEENAALRQRISGLRERLAASDAQQFIQSHHRSRSQLPGVAKSTTSPVPQVPQGPEEPAAIIEVRKTVSMRMLVPRFKDDSEITLPAVRPPTAGSTDDEPHRIRRSRSSCKMAGTDQSPERGRPVFLSCEDHPTLLTTKHKSDSGKLAAPARHAWDEQDGSAAALISSLLPPPPPTKPEPDDVEALFAWLEDELARQPERPESIGMLLRAVRIAARKACNRARAPVRHAEVLSGLLARRCAPESPTARSDADISLLADSANAASAGAAKALVCALGDRTSDALRLAACGALQSIASIDVGKASVLNAAPDAMQRVAALLTHPDESVVERVAGILNNCSSLVGAAALLVECGATKPLVGLLRLKKGRSTEYAAGAIQNIARMEIGRKAVQEEGGVDPLVDLVTCPDMQTRIAAVAALLNVFGPDCDDLERTRIKRSLATALAGASLRDCVEESDTPSAQ